MKTSRLYMVLPLFVEGSADGIREWLGRIGMSEQ